MLDIINTGFAVLWSTGKEQNIQSKNICFPMDLIEF